MRILIINKSDRTGGAAMVSYRLLQAFRREGVEARMLVTEKLSDDPDVILASSPRRYRLPFLRERLRVAWMNGFDRRSLFRFDLGSDGLPLASHPEVLAADAILINWVNQGMLSLDELDRLLALGKPVLWTLHDMWPFTAVCHHSGECERYREGCPVCPLLPPGRRSEKALRKVMERKRRAYAHPDLSFVAVSSWLADRARASSLLRDKRVAVIPNSFHIETGGQSTVTRPSADSLAPRSGEQPENGRIRLIFGAARIDDPIKNLPLLIEALNGYLDLHPEMTERVELLTYGSVKDPGALASLRFPHVHLGRVAPDRLPDLYRAVDVVLSTSLYESLPGTLVEGQAYGAIPVATDRGGQRDIIEHLRTGYLVPFADDISGTADSEGTTGVLSGTAADFIEGLEWAISTASDPQKKAATQAAMLDSVKQRFDPPLIVNEYLKMLRC